MLLKVGRGSKTSIKSLSMEKELEPLSKEDSFPMLAISISIRGFQP